MSENEQVMQLVAGYETYSDALGIGESADSGAPATTPVCASAAASAGISWMTGQFASKTYIEGC